MQRYFAEVIITLVLLVFPALAQDHAHADHPGSGSTLALSQDPGLPPGEEHAKQALEISPRHGEWVDVDVPGSTDRIRTWVVYPERRDKAPVVLVICEIYGLTDWIRAVADQLAEDGFIAIAPDLVSGKGPKGGGTESATSRDEVVRWIRELTTDEVLARLNAVRSYGIGLPAANGKTATIGFCWGGSQSFLYACLQPGLDAAVVYYGTSPDSARLAHLSKAPVLGLYGGDDARVNMTIEPAQKVLHALKKNYEVEIYEGAGHGFLRAQSGRDGANLRAAQKAWPRTIEFLRMHTK
ncbi:MAG: carboxymethylenebutenolidase [Bacteroidia bacterium]|nr:MAG: carboxymethylenebutenolidase [Bacteroidia bacterium]